MAQKRKRGNQEAQAGAPASKKQQKSSKKTSKNAAKKAPKRAPSPAVIDSTPFTDPPDRDQRLREIPLYDGLSSEDSEERIRNASAIVSGLLGGEGVEEDTLKRHLEKLFRGLASGRKGARVGFGIVLAELLGRLLGPDGLSTTKYPELGFDASLFVLESKTKPDGALSGQEEHDHFFGLLFGLQSFVKAKILFVDETRWKLVVGKIFNLALKKPWMREECGFVLLEALAQMNQSQAESLLEDLKENGLALSPEGVGIWLTARKRFPDMKVPIKPWGQSGNPLEHLKILAKALKGSSSEGADAEDTKAKQTGNWNHQVHFVWNLVLERYAADATSRAESKTSDFENLWKVAVDENLFSGSASTERKFWGLLLFQKVLETPAFEALIPSIFSQNLMRCLINQLQDKSRLLNRAAEKSLKVLVASAESNSKLLPVVLPHIIGNYGSYNFDKVTKTRTIEGLLNTITGATAESVFKLLTKPTLSIIDSSSDDVHEAELRRQLLADYILIIIRSVKPSEQTANANWIKERALLTLGKYAYSKNVKCQPPLSEKTRTTFRERLMSAFGRLLSDLDSFSYPCDLLQSIVPDAVEMDEKITEAKERAISTIEGILKRFKKASTRDKSPLQALALLYSLVIFQLYNGETDAISLLDELKLCYDKLIRKKPTEESEVEAAEVLVEILLSCISQPSVSLQKATRHVFEAFTGEMTKGSLDLMTDVLASSENLRGQQELFDRAPEEGDTVEEDGSDVEMDSDVEVVDMNGENGTLNGHLEQQDSDSESEDEEEEEEEVDDEGDASDSEEIKKFNASLAQALGTNDDSGNESDTSMTSDQMASLDSKLIEIFSSRPKPADKKAKKQEHKDAKETMISLKNRVLDLLEIYIKKEVETGNELVFGLLIPVLEMMRTTQQRGLIARGSDFISLFTRLSRSKVSNSTTEPDVEARLILLLSIHEQALQNSGGSGSFVKAASSASLMIVNSLYRADKSVLGQIADVYKDSMLSWVEGTSGSGGLAPFFVEWVNWCQSHAGDGSKVEEAKIDETEVEVAPVKPEGTKSEEIKSEKVKAEEVKPKSKKSKKNKSGGKK